MFHHSPLPRCALLLAREGDVDHTLREVRGDAAPALLERSGHGDRSQQPADLEVGGQLVGPDQVGVVDPDGWADDLCGHGDHLPSHHLLQGDEGDDGSLGGAHVEAEPPTTLWGDRQLHRLSHLDGDRG